MIEVKTNMKYITIESYLVNDQLKCRSIQKGKYSISEILDWLDEMNIYYIRYDNSFYFENTKDVTLFQITWC